MRGGCGGKTCNSGQRCLVAVVVKRMAICPAPNARPALPPVQREAGVSHAFLYGNPDLRARIERLRSQARPQQAQSASDDRENTLILALTSQVTRLKKQHRDETTALRAALEQAHGENLQLRRELARLGWNGQLAAT